jgi:hypothetical protein
MNPELKTKWVKALRSGKFAQVEGYLKTENGFCCLGVLAEIYGCTVTPKSSEPGGETHIDGYVPNGGGELLPDDLANHIGITFVQQEYYAGMNDESNTFAQIADDIETNESL